MTAAKTPPERVTHFYDARGVESNAFSAKSVEYIRADLVKKREGALRAALAECLVVMRLHAPHTMQHAVLVAIRALAAADEGEKSR